MALKISQIYAGPGVVTVNENDVPLPEDQLLVVAEDGDRTYVATGWQSAITNNFPDSSYVTDPGQIAKNDQLANSEGPHLKPGAKPKRMTKAQVGEYAIRLIREQNLDLAKPKKITFA